MFLCISGYLYGQRYEAKKLFLVQSFAKILISYYIVFLAFGSIHLFWLGSLSFADIIKGVFSHVPFPGGGHLWFVFTILCCYFFTPILYYVFNKNDSTLQLIIKSVFMLIFTQIFFDRISHFFFTQHFNSPWINCYVLGFVIARISISSEKMRVSLVWLLLAIALLLNVTKIYSTYIHELHFPLSGLLFQYAHVLLGACLFVGLKEMLVNTKQNRLFELSDCYSYEIYLVHHFFILGPLSLMDISPFMSINIILVLFLVCILSVLVKRFSVFLRKQLVLFCRLINVS